jgi:hypothetical protein
MPLTPVPITQADLYRAVLLLKSRDLDFEDFWNSLSGRDRRSICKAVLRRRNVEGVDKEILTYLRQQGLFWGQ